MATSAVADDSLQHLRKMKRRVGGSNMDLPMEEKVDLLEKTISVFRSEVDMKLRIMHQILTTRNGKLNYAEPYHMIVRRYTFLVQNQYFRILMSTSPLYCFRASFCS